MEQALDALGIPTLDGMTPDALKRAFKSSVVNAHPDKGGKEGDFDAILSAYVYLSGVLKRYTGGRNGQAVLDVTEVRQARDAQFTNELNNLVSDIFDQLESTDNESFRKEFNEQFERVHVREERGYGEWLKEEEKENAEPTMPLENKEWNRAFEQVIRSGRPPPTTLALHLDEMATISGTTRGATLISMDHSFTSEPSANPEYTDVHDAYTSEHTLLDKLPVYQETRRTFEELLKERDMVYQTEEDRDVAAIAAYEKRRGEEEKSHKQRIADYFKTTTSSCWALRSERSERSEQSALRSEPTDSFVKEFK